MISRLFYFNIALIRFAFFMVVLFTVLTFAATAMQKAHGIIKKSIFKGVNDNVFMVQVVDGIYSGSKVITDISSSIIDAHPTTIKMQSITDDVMQMASGYDNNGNYVGQTIKIEKGSQLEEFYAFIKSSYFLALDNLDSLLVAFFSKEEYQEV